MDRPELGLPAGLDRELAIGTAGQEGVDGSRIGTEDGVVEERAATMRSVGRVMLQEHPEDGAGGLEVLDRAPSGGVGLGETGADTELLAGGGVP